jgi:thioredoxin reductase
VPFGDDGKPIHAPDTYETPVRGVFVAGAMSQDGFIYIARERVRLAIETIARRLQGA